MPASPVSTIAAAATTGAQPFPGEKVGTVSEKLTVGPIITIQAANINGAPNGYEFVEDYASVHPSGTSAKPWVVADNCASSGSPHFAWTCGNETYSTWTTYTASNLSCIGDVSIAEPSSFHPWVTGLNNTNTNAYYFSSGGPCDGSLPVGCGYAWPNNPDYPHVFYDWTRGVTWMTFRECTLGGNECNGTNPTQLWFVELPSNPSTSCDVTYFIDPCTSASDFYNNATSAVDINGIIHTVYWNHTVGDIEHDQFDPTTDVWTCGGLQGSVGTITTPPNNSACPKASNGVACRDGRPTVPNMGAAPNCVGAPGEPSLAIDPHTNGAWIVTYPYYNSSTNDVVTRFYRYDPTNPSLGWHYESVTTDTEVFPRVASASAEPFSAGKQGDFQTQTTALVANGETEQVSWVSTNGGQTWTGTYISTPQLFPVNGAYGVGSCYDGDYNGIAYDWVKNGYFYTWVNGSNGNWTTEGTFVTLD
jgi:hypothetical protein